VLTLQEYNTCFRH